MKKLVLFICCIIVAVSCNLNGSYYAENVAEIVTIQSGKLVRDNGNALTVVQESGVTVASLNEGERYYLIFDILKQYYDEQGYAVNEIRLKSATPVEIIVPAMASESEEITACDPVLFDFNWLGPKFLDMGLILYTNPKSNCAHNLFARYSLDETGSVLTLYLYHDGNNENPAYMDEKDLVTKGRIISIPMDRWENLKELRLTCDRLTWDGESGCYKVTRITSSTAGNVE